MARWYCVRTHLHGELTADIEIRLAGFTLFAPSLWKPAEPPRRAAGGAMRPSRPDRIVPLFPRYLFVRFRRSADDWRRIRYMPGVEGFIGPTSELPAVMPDQAIDLIRSFCSPNGCWYPPTRRDTPFPVGARARILKGPMADLAGLCTWSDGKRVQVLLSLLGRPVPVTVAQAAVEAA